MVLHQKEFQVSHKHLEFGVSRTFQDSKFLDNQSLLLFDKLNVVILKIGPSLLFKV